MILKTKLRLPKLGGFDREHVGIQKIYIHLPIVYINN
jgi:hypothetical protein